MTSQLDALDKLAAKAFDGFIVRKDLVRTYARQFTVPTYVVEFMLGKFCASTDADEIKEGLEIVQRQLTERTVRTGDHELFKANARKHGSLKLIDKIDVRLEQRTDTFLANLPSLLLTDVRIADEIVHRSDRLLTGGIYVEVDLEYDAAMAAEKNGRPFCITVLREIQMARRDVTDILAQGREMFTTDEWKALLLRSVGLEASQLSPRAQDLFFLRMVPFVEKNYNSVELGPRGTGKSFLFQQVSPYSHLVSGGKASVATMFVNNASNQRGIVCQYDVVCFDEVSGISFDQKDGVNIMKGYMESGEFSRGKTPIRAEGSIVMVGNFDVDMQQQQRVGHLLGPLPPEMRNDAAFLDRLHAYVPGWDIPKMGAELYTNHVGLVSDFLTECWSQLRRQTRISALQGTIHFGAALSGRDTNAVYKTVSGLLKLLHPAQDKPIPLPDLEWAVRLALESRRRVKEQQKRIVPAEFRNTHFSYTVDADGVEQFVVTPELHNENHIGTDPLPAGQIWTMGPGQGDEGPGLYRIEAIAGPGSGVHILNRPAPAAFAESVRCAEQNLYARANEFVGDRDPRAYEFSVQMRAHDASRSATQLGVATVIALASALLKKSVRGGLVVVGGLNLGGSLESVTHAVGLVEHAVERGAATVLLPVSCRRQLLDLSDDMATKVDLVFYSDARDALLKAVVE